MALPIKTGLPDTLIVTDSYIIRWRAVDPTTGADVSGVVITEAAVQASNAAAGGATGPYMLVPGPKS